MNSLGPCPDCGEALGADQRYCANCGHRVEAPLAPTYTPFGPTEPAAARSGGWPFPIPISMAGLFAALALAFGVVMGTAVSPNLSELIASGKLDSVLGAAAPPASEPAPVTADKGGAKSAPPDTGGSSSSTSSPGSSFHGTSGSTPSYGGASPNNGSKKKKKKKPDNATYLTGTVVRKNPVAGSYSISSGGGLSAIHAKVSAGLPAPGTKVKVPIRQLANRTYAEDGKRQKKGQTTFARFSGVVTDSRDTADPAIPDNYTVSGRGASVLVHVSNQPALATPPAVGKLVTTTVEISAAASTPVPPSLPPTFACALPVSPFPNPPILPEKELFQTAISEAATVTATEIETVVQATCPGPPGTVLLSSDDIREGATDLVLSSGSLDLARLLPGQPIIASVMISGGALTDITGTASDQGINGADDKASGQGNLIRVARASERRVARAAKRSRR